MARAQILQSLGSNPVLFLTLLGAIAGCTQQDAKQSQRDTRQVALVIQEPRAEPNSISMTPPKRIRHRTPENETAKETVLAESSHLTVEDPRTEVESTYVEVPETSESAEVEATIAETTEAKTTDVDVNEEIEVEVAEEPVNDTYGGDTGELVLEPDDRLEMESQSDPASRETVEIETPIVKAWIETVEVAIQQDATVDPIVENAQVEVPSLSELSTHEPSVDELPLTPATTVEVAELETISDIDSIDRNVASDEPVNAGDPNDVATITEDIGAESPVVTVSVTNPESTKLPVAFMVNDKLKTLRSGETFELTIAPDEFPAIQFDRGREFGKVKYMLDASAATRYEFEITRWGWDLSLASLLVTDR